MSRTRLTVAALVTVTAWAVASAVPARAVSAPPANPPILIAQDATPVSESTDPALVGIDANLVNGLSVTGHGGEPVTASAPGQPTRTIIAPAGRPAVLRSLTAGVRYTVAIGGRPIGSAVPLAQVGPASGLKVETTGTPGTVQLTWTHTARTGEGKSIAFDVSATPLTADGSDSPNIATVTSTGRSATLTSLIPSARYRFTVTPRNAASAGRPSTATMTRTLADLAGSGSTQPVSPTAPAPAPPATKTVWVCPNGYSEDAGTCRATLPYTFSYAPYTFHTVVTGPAPVLNSYETVIAACPVGYNLEDYGWVAYCRLYGQAPTATVKDATPPGATDTGTQWITKNPTPSGYSDDGTQWVTTAPKIATTVPA